MVCALEFRFRATIIISLIPMTRSFAFKVSTLLSVLVWHGYARQAYRSVHPAEERQFPDSRFGRSRQRRAEVNPTTIREFYSTVLHIPGLDYKQLSQYYNGLDRRLTDGPRSCD